MTVELSVVLMPKEIQAKRPSDTESPSRVYSNIGSTPSVSVSEARMLSSALVVRSWVLVE